MKTYICQECGKEFSRDHPGKYCSRKCAKKHVNKGWNLTAPTAQNRADKMGMKWY